MQRQFRRCRTWVVASDSKRLTQNSPDLAADEFSSRGVTLYGVMTYERTLRDSKAEPALTFKLSEGHLFRCSECNQAIASIGRGPYIAVMGLIDLIATFELHVRRHHGN
jgi:hypothetical protein